MPHRFARHFRTMLLAGVAALALSACATNRTSMASPDFSGMPADQAQQTVAGLAAKYQSNPRDKANIIYYAAVLRATGKNAEAVTVLEAGATQFKGDADIQIAYAKALTSAGRFEQAMGVLDNAGAPLAADWNALSVRGAVLDQMGRNVEARQFYQQALLIAPNEASLEANMGLSFAMTNDLVQAEQHLLRAAGMPGSNSKIRQNLALVFGLQGRFDEARAIYAAELPPEQVENNMSYIRALLTQQNRWAQIEGAQ